MKQHSTAHIIKMAAASRAATCDTEVAIVRCGNLELFTEHERGEGYRLHFRWGADLVWSCTGFHARIELAAPRVRRKAA